MNPVLSFPEGAKPSGLSQLPLAFIVPGRLGVASRSTQVKDLTEVFNSLGMATLSVDGQEMKQVFTVFEKMRDSAAIDCRRILLVGFAEGADQIARAYHELYAIEPPWGIVLLSSTVGPMYLNNLACPYLLIHGERDAQFQTFPYERIRAATRHHQMRYGDLTTCYQVSDLNSELGSNQGTGRLDARVLEQVSFWLRKLQGEERAPKTAA